MQNFLRGMIKAFARRIHTVLADKLDLGLVVAYVVVGVMLLTALFVQFRSHKYVPAMYWVAVVLISVARSLVTDNLVDNLGVPL